MIENIRQRYNIPVLKNIYVDHDAEHILQCEKRGLNVMRADKGAKSVVEGIETVSKVIGDNRLIVNTTSLEERDINVADSPQGFAEEVLSYAYPPLSDRPDRTKYDNPIKKDDHSCDQVRYILHTRESTKAEPYIFYPRITGI